MVVPKEHVIPRLLALIRVPAAQTSDAPEDHAAAVNDDRHLAEAVGRAADGGADDGPTSTGAALESRSTCPALQEVLSRLNASPPWSDYDVGAQCERLLLSHLGRTQGAAMAGSCCPPHRTPFGETGIVIPWGGLAGVTLFAHVGTPTHDALLSLPSRVVGLPAYGPEASARVAYCAQPEVWDGALEGARAMAARRG